MACKLKRRLDDIPKTGRGEHTYSCEECGALMFGKTKPQCRRAMLAQVQARHASAEAEADMLHLNDKVKPQ